MEKFPDRTHVRLWMESTSTQCLYADEDGERIMVVAVDADEPLDLHTVWAVHRLVRDGVDYVLFHNAAYGRYLFVDEHGSGQCTYESAEQQNVLFQARSAEDYYEDEDVILSNPIIGDLYDQERDDDDDTPVHWLVEPVPPRQVPPALPPPPEPIPPPPMRFTGIIGLRRKGGPAPYVFAVPPQPVLRRRINYVQADGEGNFNPQQWRVLENFEGQSVFNLRKEIAVALGANNNLNITLCVSGGSNGRWTPLVIDLPPDEKTMNIIVLTTGTTAAEELVYPYAEE